MTEIETLKQWIIEDYNSWVDLCMLSMKDENIGIKNLMTSNFELKINQLIKLTEDGKNGPFIEGTVAGSPKKW